MTRSDQPGHDSGHERPQLTGLPRRLFVRARTRFHRMSDLAMFAVFAALSVGGCAWSFVDHSEHVRVAGVAIILMVFGSLVLSGTAMLGIVGILTVGVLVVVFAHDQVSSQLTASGVVMLVSVAVVAVLQARRRSALGLRRTSAESVLERVRRRTRAQAAMPELPMGWHVEVAQRAADGAAFAGDFVCARLVDDDGPHLELVLVDVSGNGIDAGSRALLFSGAVGGLLGAVPPDEFLARCNDYLSRQGWGSGFASASYLRLDLTRWCYELRSAGHPPVMVWTAATSSVRRSRATGTVLGVVDEHEISVESGRLAVGDALVLYTDGVVEDRARDLDTGMARLEHRLASSIGHGAADSQDSLAERLVDGCETDGRDDRTVVTVWNADAPQQRSLDGSALDSVARPPANA